MLLLAKQIGDFRRGANSKLMFSWFFLVAILGMRMCGPMDDKNRTID
jgi:hypothetical protein